MTPVYNIFRKISLTCMACILTCSLTAQIRDSISYPVVIQFNSECCGVPSDKPLKNYVKAFRKKYKIKKITALHVGPMGKEGEYWLAFSFKELSRKQAAVFTRGLKLITAKLKDRGSATLVENTAIVHSDLPVRAIPERVNL